MLLASIDLNLLRGLEMLLQERNVTRAARAMNVSQSTMSGVLRRLRELFDDELLMRVGREYRLTARATELYEPLTAALRLIRKEVLDRNTFDPTTLERQFRILSSDYTNLAVLNAVVCDLASKAPGISFSIMRPSPESSIMFERGELDLSLVPQNSVRDPLLSRSLIEDGMSVIGCRHNERIANGLDEAAFMELPHVAVQIYPGHYPLIENWLRGTYGRRRQVAVYVSSFLEAPELIVGTNRIMALHTRFADAFTKRYPLRKFACPVEGPRSRLAIHWHAASAGDVALHWLIERICAHAEALRSAGDQHADRRQPQFATA